VVSRILNSSGDGYEETVGPGRLAQMEEEQIDVHTVLIGKPHGKVESKER
jgi:hypothetical protein